MIQTKLLHTALLLSLSAGVLCAGEKSMMHCFAFTPIESATDAEWKAFWDATDKWPSQTKAISKVWYGKLRAPLAQYSVDAEASKKLRAGEKDVAAAKTSVTRRQYGVCMEMTGPEALKSYTELPYHKTWMDAYEKVRVAGTTTYDILGQ